MKKQMFKLNASHGNTLIELMIVMSMVALLGGVILGLVSTGGSAFQKIQAAHSTQTEARLALSYITVKVRQNDVQAGIVLNNPSSIHIVNPSGGYWDIYQDGSGNLKEDNYDGTNHKISTIAEGITFSATLINKQLTLTIGYSGGTKQLNEIIALRSD